MAMASPFPLLSLLFLLPFSASAGHPNQNPTPFSVPLAPLLTKHPPFPLAASPSQVLEEGYAISTVFDGNNLPVPLRPYSLHPLRSTLLVLDSVGSSFFALPLPLSQDGDARRFAGTGESGYSDGGRDVSSFAHPRSFAVDGKGNVYVADRSSHVIRKINAEGVTTTVAGGYSRKPGKTDGPAQNASFSDDFELAYIPEMCALLISDRGNSLIRQMNLKQEDCTYNSQKGLGGTSVSLIAIVCALVGFAIGMVARPYLVSCTGNTQLQTRHDMEALPSHSGVDVTDSLLRHQKRNC